MKQWAAEVSAATAATCFYSPPFKSYPSDLPCCRIDVPVEPLLEWPEIPHRSHKAVAAGIEGVLWVLVSDVSHILVSAQWS